VCLINRWPLVLHLDSQKVCTDLAFKDMLIFVRMSTTYT
jgi:hypothetical protein